MGMRSVSHPPDYARRQDEEQTGVEIATKVLGKNSKPGQAPFYTGDSPGFGAILDICSPSEQPAPRHILLASKTAVSLSPEDKAYLQYKGVFNMPRKETCDALLRAYFHHVHPIVPVVDATTLPHLYPSGDSQQYNLILLWSIFYVAANHVSADTWKSEGYSSRKGMKDSMYSRATCLHHNGGETDHTVLLQSALLLGFYHSEADTHTQPWYWLGVAISLCQTIGLHRCSAAVCANSPIPVQQQRLWRRLWWTCFYRDRWLSLTMGRPLRININDCNTAMPSADDMLGDFTGLPESIVAAYIPKDLPQLAEYWVMTIQLTQLLGDTLTLSYQPFGAPSSLQKVEALENRILQFQLPESQEAGQSPLATFYLYHLQLHYQAFIITFYRPFITKAPEGLPDSRQTRWQAHVRHQMDMGALQTNAVLDSLVREKLLGFSGPMTPPLLVPAMHVHLLNCKSPDPLSRRLGLNKLELCMIVLEQMKDTHPSSSVFRGIFLEAIRYIFPSYVAQSTIPELSTSESSMPQDITLDDPLAGFTIGEDAIDALMDEVSIFNFWESLNSMQT
ncbi:Transcription factor [Penicillium paradoxum]|uniref:Transcription factor n=1 Tax=Penicillium paradoxum TaxID=176176 RepID=UPI002546DB1B|nr:Transcription factor [Penicillium paradoxum]KAJ5782825.1 Transcription factor [Penicillium paradoxum]